MRTFIVKRPPRSLPKLTMELSPLEIIQLEEAMLKQTQFCCRDHYVEGVCEACGCFVCASLLISGKGGTA